MRISPFFTKGHLFAGLKLFKASAFLLIATIASLGNAMSENLTENKAELDYKFLGYLWQDGEWFRIPVEYLSNPIPSPDTLPILADKKKMEGLLREHESVTGFNENGLYTPELIKSSTSPKINFAFIIENLEPFPTNLYYNPNISEPNAAIIRVDWAGGNARPTPEDYRRVFDRYYAEIGPAKPLKEGHLEKMMSSPIPYERRGRGYYIYEASENYEVNLWCSVEAAQPLCKGQARDPQSGAYIYVTFPESAIWNNQSWLSVVSPAFQFINSWRLELNE